MTTKPLSRRKDDQMAHDREHGPSRDELRRMATSPEAIAAERYHAFRIHLANAADGHEEAARRLRAMLALLDEDPRRFYAVTESAATVLEWAQRQKG